MTKRLNLIVCSIICLLLFCSFCAAAPRDVSAWVSIATPWGVWKDTFGDPFPVKTIVKDLAELGVKEVFIQDENWYLFHPTQVNYAFKAQQMGTRDFLEEILTETKKYNMNVVLVWTPDDRWCETTLAMQRKDLYARDENNNPIIGSYPNIGFHDLASPVVKKMYRDLIEEVAANYLSKHKNLKGIYWHELGVSEGRNEHKNHLNEFKLFCKKNYGEDYTGSKMPYKADPSDKWWRRYCLYKNDVVTSFIKEMRDCSRQHGLKTYFCYYPPETAGEESWKWGFDPVALENLCDHMWVAGFPVESGKPYHLFKGSILDFGPAYAGQNLARNYSYAFHGRPLSIWENRVSMYLDVTRKFFAGKRLYSDYYTQFLGHSQKEISLFLGKENIGKWVDLMSFWRGGTSVSTVAVAVNPVPFILQNRAVGNAYNDKVRNLMISLSSAVDVDGLVLGSESMDAMLKELELIIIPEQMGVGLDKKTVNKLLGFMSKGGKILLINSPLVESKPDLTQKVDLTERLFGIKIEDSVTGKFDKIEARLPLNASNRTWVSGYKVELSKDVEILASDSEGYPILCRKGNLYYSTIGFSENLAPYMSSVVSYLANPIVSLTDKTGELRILETVKKNGMLCVSLFGKGQGKLVIDISRFTDKKISLQAKDIVTGRPVKVQVAKGKAIVQADIKHTDQPYILVIGNKSKLSVFQGIYSSENVFMGMEKGIEIENPEVPIAVPTGQGPRIGVYYAGFGTQEIIAALKNAGKRVFSLPRLDSEGINSCDILVIPQLRNSMFYNQALPLLRKWVEGGGGVLLTHDAVGYRGHKVAFPEIGKGNINPKSSTVTVAKEHAVTKGMTKNTVFLHSYADYIEIVKGTDGEVVVTGDNGRQPVVVTGKVGKGRVILNGMLPGYGSLKRGEYAGADKELSGEELILLLNSIEWLGGK